jgi:hypothetical protein
VHAPVIEPGLNALLAYVNKPQVLPKNAVNPKWQKNQKNRYRKEQVALPSLKRSGFVFLSAAFKVKRY